MKTVLCTLYNSLYLDKGLVLYNSLCECAKDFELYVLCMDEKCYEVLSDIGEERLKPIHLSDVENDKMLEAKSNRSVAEYCWTCSSRLIQYILSTFHPECCTYIDADMYFYHDPQLLIDEMLEAGKSVMMVPHRFTERNIHLAKTVGTYCVEFNCFRNNENGFKVLNHWHNKCLECCSNIGDGIHWGDQKYMDEWPVLFSEIVHVCEHAGAGIAPWNIESYKECNINDSSVLYRDNTRIPIVFYHFQSVSYISRETVRTGIGVNRFTDYSLVNALYEPYLTKLDKVKGFLIKQYDINLLVTSHPSVKTARWKKWLKSFSIVRTIDRIIKKEEKDYVISIHISNE